MQNKTLRNLYSQELADRINDSNILIVGVGGIGCELLKTLTSSGFRKMTLIDLDTIEKTNLNRQFYFRREHAEKHMSKAEVGRESILRKRPDLDITAICASIFEDRFNVEFYKTFDLVFCALDNNEAREHLGRMCMRSNRILVDSGTGGFNGQANVIKRFFSQCNNCVPSKPAPQFAICTIRAMPVEPIHCIVYGISLYNLFFGPKDETNFLWGILELGQASDDLQATGIRIFNTLFHEQQQPDPQKTVIQYKFPITYEEGLKIDTIFSNEDQSIKEPKDRLLPFKNYVQDFVEYFVQISKYANNSLKFDKDDYDCVKFVAAAANMRTYNFAKRFQIDDPSIYQNEKLKFLSEYQVRKLGGKIIAAIASTNSIAAALETIDACKVFQEKFDKLRTSWISTGYEKIAPTYLSDPYDTCNYCSLRVIYIHLFLDMNVKTIQVILDIAQIFGVAHLDISVNNGGTIYGLENKRCKSLNAMNINKPIKEFNKNKDYQQLTFSISNYSRKFYWNLGERYEFIVMHKEDINQIQPDTSMEKCLQQLKDLQISNYQKLNEQRLSFYEEYGY